MAKAALKAPTKTQILANIAEQTELSKKDVAAVFDALGGEIGKAISKGGPGQSPFQAFARLFSKTFLPSQSARDVILLTVPKSGSNPSQQARN